MKKDFFLLLFLLLIFLCTTPLIAQTPFEHMDQNRDGVLSKSEFKGPPLAFSRLDRNNDDYITRQEAQGTRLLSGRDLTKKVEIQSSARKSTDLVYVDTHNHLVGQRVMGQFNLEKPAQIAVDIMDEAGVKLNLLMPMPQTVHQKLCLTFEDLLPIVQRYPSRFAALGGGGSLNVMIQQALQDGHVSTAMEKEFDARALELVRKGVVGFGEMTTEHFSMDEKHPYETAPPDHPLFLRLADLAAKYDLPIDIHMEAIPVEMPMPSRFQSPPNPKILKPNISPFTKLLAHNRKAKIIWVHLGWDNTGERTIDLTRKLLAENPNLYMSIRIASGMQERKGAAPNFPLDHNGQLKQEWLTLFQEYPDRFLIGSDEIIKSTNNHPSAGSIHSTVCMLEQLPVKLRRQIGYENAYQVYRIKK